MSLEAPRFDPAAQRAADIARGVARLFAMQAIASVTELSLPNGRRADVVGLSAAGDITIVEVKSSLEDFRSDHKWPEYRDFCDALLFAVAPGFPVEVLPEDAGLILADRFGAEVVRPGPVARLPAARRRSMILHFARVAAARLHGLSDPELGYERLVSG